MVHGQNLGALGETALAILRRRIGFVFQDHKLLFDRNAFDNVALPLRVAGFARDEIGRRVRAALDKVGLLAREKAMPVALSGGEQQRVCIARAIVNRPAILIADEPTGNLDADYARAILDLFVSFHQVGVTVLLSTHDEASLGRLGCRRVALTGGTLVEARMSVWLRLHWHALADAFRRLAAQPVAAVFSILVLAVAIALPVMAAVALQSVGAVTAGLETDPHVNVYLALDATDEDVKRDRRSAALAPAGRRRALHPARRGPRGAQVDHASRRAPREPRSQPSAARIHSPRAHHDAAELAEAAHAEWSRLPKVDQVVADFEWSERLGRWVRFGNRVLAMVALVLGAAVAFIVGHLIRLQVLPAPGDRGEPADRRHGLRRPPAVPLPRARPGAPGGRRRRRPELGSRSGSAPSCERSLQTMPLNLKWFSCLYGTGWQYRRGGAARASPGLGGRSGASFGNFLPRGRNISKGLALQMDEC